MSASAHRGDHDIAFYEALLEETYGATAVVGSLAYFNDDDAGPLLPGRYLVQAVGISSEVVWVHRGAYIGGGVLAPVGGGAVPGPARFPLTQSIVAVEFHVLQAHSDRIAVQASAGIGVACFLSRVSSVTRKGL